MAVTDKAPSVTSNLMVPVKALRDLYRAYVGLLESGKERIEFHGGTCDSVEQMEKGDPYLIAANVAIQAAEIEARRAQQVETKADPLAAEVHRLRLIINGPVSNELLVESLSFLRAGFPVTGLDVINRIEQFLRDNPVPEGAALNAQVASALKASAPAKRMSRAEAQQGFDAMERAYWKSVEIVDGLSQIASDDPRATPESHRAYNKARGCDCNSDCDVHLLWCSMLASAQNGSGDAA